MSLEVCASHGIKLKFQPFVTFSRVHLGLGGREVVTLGRQSGDINLQACKEKGLPVACAVSQIFSLPVKCKPNAVLAEIRTLWSDISVLRSSVATLLLV